VRFGPGDSYQMPIHQIRFQNIGCWLSFPKECQQARFNTRCNDIAGAMIHNPHIILQDACDLAKRYGVSHQLRSALDVGQSMLLHSYHQLSGRRPQEDARSSNYNHVVIGVDGRIASFNTPRFALPRYEFFDDALKNAASTAGVTSVTGELKKSDDDSSSSGARSREETDPDSFPVSEKTRWLRDESGRHLGPAADASGNNAATECVQALITLFKTGAPRSKCQLIECYFLIGSCIRAINARIQMAVDLEQDGLDVLSGGPEPMGWSKAASQIVGLDEKIGVSHFSKANSRILHDLLDITLPRGAYPLDSLLHGADVGMEFWPRMVLQGVRHDNYSLAGVFELMKKIPLGYMCSRSHVSRMIMPYFRYNPKEEVDMYEVRLSTALPDTEWLSILLTKNTSRLQGVVDDLSACVLAISEAVVDCFLMRTRRQRRQIQYTDTLEMDLDWFDQTALAEGAPHWWAAMRAWVLPSDILEHMLFEKIQLNGRRSTLSEVRPDVVNPPMQSGIVFMWDPRFNCIQASQHKMLDVDAAQNVTAFVPVFHIEHFDPMILDQLKTIVKCDSDTDFRTMPENIIRDYNSLNRSKMVLYQSAGPGGMQGLAGLQRSEPTPTDPAAESKKKEPELSAVMSMMCSMQGDMKLMATQMAADRAKKTAEVLELSLATKVKEKEVDLN